MLKRSVAQNNGMSGVSRSQKKKTNLTDNTSENIETATPETMEKEDDTYAREEIEQVEMTILQEKYNLPEMSTFIRGEEKGKLQQKKSREGFSRVERPVRKPTERNGIDVFMSLTTREEQLEAETAAKKN